MKKNRLSLSMLLNREMNEIRGGEAEGPCGRCSCACAYANQGGSSELDNSTANFRSHKYSMKDGVWYGWSCCENTLEAQNKYLR